MPGRFFDSNILLYLAADDAAKADNVETLLAGGGVISVQVLNEIAHVARRKMRLGLAETTAYLALFRRVLEVVPLTLDTHDTGMSLAADYRLSTYDSMIVAAALQAGCDTLFSEDMQHGLVIRGKVTIIDPFKGG